MNIEFHEKKHKNLEDGALKYGEEGLLELSPSPIAFDLFPKYSGIVPDFEPFPKYSGIVPDFELFARYWFPLTLEQE